MVVYGFEAEASEYVIPVIRPDSAVADTSGKAPAQTGWL